MNAKLAAISKTLDRCSPMVGEAVSFILTDFAASKEYAQPGRNSLYVGAEQFASGAYESAFRHLTVAAEAVGDADFLGPVFHALKLSRKFNYPDEEVHNLVNGLWLSQCDANQSARGLTLVRGQAHLAGLTPPTVRCSTYWLNAFNRHLLDPAEVRQLLTFAWKPETHEASWLIDREVRSTRYTQPALLGSAQQAAIYSAAIMHLDTLRRAPAPRIVAEVVGL